MKRGKGHGTNRGSRKLHTDPDSDYRNNKLTRRANRLGREPVPYRAFIDWRERWLDMLGNKGLDPELTEPPLLPVPWPYPEIPLEPWQERRLREIQLRVEATRTERADRQRKARASSKLRIEQSGKEYVGVV